MANKERGTANDHVLSSACWALSYLSDGSNDGVEAIMEAGVCPRLVELLKHPSACVQIPAIRTVSNIARDERWRQAAIDVGELIESLIDLLETAEFAIKKEVVQAFVNVISGRTSGSVAVQRVKRTTDFNFVVKLIYEAQQGLDKIEALQSHDNDEIREKALEVWEPLYNEAPHVWKFFEWLGFLSLWC
ncbi:OLC1v1024001C1 [Oldenlandia corymbosa var. corymbosa]|uniref:OLC1v1024001C1 n=1 Tax=Oldenlandia corymbosa var. corymbosa TaxID=529605 RepID=A0AAV1C181_OLDCO|nr:OLC1v1024001C1 [Oldenlandia corymbosa var. corymbosa]